MSKFNEDKDIYFDYSEEKYKMFSEDTQKFIEAICYMATIESKNLDKDKINIKIKTIQSFIENCQSVNNSVNNMFGFKEKIGEIEFGTREYYFFIADIKIKSVVYLLRIENFLKNWEKLNYNIEERRKTFIKNIKNMKISDMKTFFEISKETRHDGNTFLEIMNRNILYNEGFSVAFWEDEDKEKIVSNEQEKLFQQFCESIFSFLKNKQNEDNIKNDIKTISKIYKNQKERISVKILEKKDEDKFDNQDQLYQMNGIISFDNAIELFSKTQKEQDIKSIEYYLFDNSMNEVTFCGIEWNWLWRYEKGEEDLFRCVGTDKFTYSGHYNGGNRRLYYQNMIKNIVMHMNKGGSNKLSSYSKNPFRDIYKYMISEYQDNDEDVDYFFEITVENNDIKASLIDEGNEIKPIVFAMIKNANTNIIKKMEKPSQSNSDFFIQNNCYQCAPSDSISFSGFVLGEDDAENEYNFCVDIFNTKETYSGDIRKVFGEYTHSFPEVGVPHHQMSVVASSDNEVVMLGNTCDRIEMSLVSERYDDCKENIEYRVQLNRDEILSLFYKMHMLCNKGKVHIKPKLIFEDGKYCCNGIPVNFEEDNTIEFVNKLKECFKKENPEEKINNITELISDDIYEQIVLSKEINSMIKNQDENLVNGKKIKNIEDAVSEFEKEIIEKIKDCIINKVKKDISSNKINFILSFLRNTEYKSYPNYGNRTYRVDADKLVALYRKLFLK